MKAPRTPTSHREGGRDPHRGRRRSQPRMPEPGDPLDERLILEPSSVRQDDHVRFWQSGPAVPDERKELVPEDCRLAAGYREAFGAGSHEPDQLSIERRSGLFRGLGGWGHVDAAAITSLGDEQRVVPRLALIEEGY